MFIINWFNMQGQALRNSFKENRKEFLFKYFWQSSVILFGLSAVYIFFQRMFQFISYKGLSAEYFAFVSLSFTLLVLLPLVFYSALVCALSFLFQKEEISFYFSLPLSTVSVFALKFMQVYYHSTRMVFLGLIAFLAAVGNYLHIGYAIYFVGAGSLLVFLLIPVTAAVILVLVVSRIIPFVRAKGILTVIGLLVGSLLVTVIRLMRPEQLVTSEGKMRLVTFIHNFQKPWMTAFPSEWVTNGVYALKRQDYAAVFSNVFSLGLLAAALLGLTLFLARAFYKKAWIEAVTTSCPVNKRVFWQRMLDLIPVELRGFIRKDLLIFYRDTVEKGSLLILVPMCFVYFYSVHVLDRYLRNAGADQLFSFLYMYIFNFFYSSVVVAGLSGRWVFPSVSMEGENIRLIKGACARFENFLKAKFWLGFLPLFILAQALTLISSIILRLDLPFVMVTVFVSGLLCYGIVLICLILGMRQADFSIKSPLDFALSMKGFICLMWEFLFVGIVIVLVGVLTALFFEKGLSGVFILFSLIGFAGILAVLWGLKKLYVKSIAALYKKEV